MAQRTLKRLYLREKNKPTHAKTFIKELASINSRRRIPILFIYSKGKSRRSGRNREIPNSCEPRLCKLRRNIHCRRHRNDRHSACRRENLWERHRANQLQHICRRACNNHRPWISNPQRQFLSRHWDQAKIRLRRKPERKLRRTSCKQALRSQDSQPQQSSC